MKRIAVLCLVVGLLTSCFEVEQVDNSRIKDELRLVKPMRISDGELMAMAQEVGDSLYSVIKSQNDTLYKIDEHEVLVASKDADTLNDGLLAKYYGAFQYSIKSGNGLRSDVKKQRHKDYVNYYNALAPATSEIKLVAMRIKIKALTIKIARQREQERLEKKLGKMAEKDVVK